MRENLEDQNSEVMPMDRLRVALISITRLVLDAPPRRQVGANGKRKIEAECSPQVIAQKTMEVYWRAVKAHASRECARLKTSPTVASRSG